MSNPDEDVELERLAEEWIAVWQSEIAGLMADREMAAAWSALLPLTAAWSDAAFAPRRSRAARPDGGDAAPPRPAAAAPAPGPRGDEGLGGGDGDDAGHLRARVAELERRLAALEARPAGGDADPRGPRRRRARA